MRQILKFSHDMDVNEMSKIGSFVLLSNLIRIQAED